MTGPAPGPCPRAWPKQIRSESSGPEPADREHAAEVWRARHGGAPLPDPVSATGPPGCESKNGRRDRARPPASFRRERCGWPRAGRRKLR